MFKKLINELKEQHSKRFGDGRPELIWEYARYLITRNGQLVTRSISDMPKTDYGVDVIGSVRHYETNRLDMYLVDGSNGLNKVAKKELQILLIAYKVNGVWENAFSWRKENGQLYGYPSLYRFGKWVYILAEEYYYSISDNLEKSKNDHQYRYADFDEE